MCFTISLVIAERIITAIMNPRSKFGFNEQRELERARSGTDARRERIDLTSNYLFSQLISLLLLNEIDVN